MPSPASHIIRLYYHAQSGQLTAQEQVEWEAFVEANPEQAAHLARLEETDELTAALATRSPHAEEALRLEMLGMIFERIDMEDGKVAPVRVHRVHFLKTAWLRVAVAVIILFGIGAYLWLQPSSDSDAITQTKPVPAKNDVMPGYNRAVLTLSDGKTVTLDSAAGKIITDGSVAIKNNEGQLYYSGGDVAAMNTMTTPKGGQYQLTLADGTKVWLNAASSITYPTAFAGKTREVEITGEVYFEVAKNSQQPFIVNAKDINIQVLGTNFNINCYENEQAIQTTLLQGKIKVSNGVSEKVLLPDQQLMIKDNSFVVKSINADHVVAWKNGYFNLNGASVQEVMRQLERWYDITVKYESAVPVRKFEGKIPRSLVLSDVIEVLQQLKVNFTLEGRTLYVK